MKRWSRDFGLGGSYRCAGSLVTEASVVWCSFYSMIWIIMLLFRFFGSLVLWFLVNEAAGAPFSILLLWPPMFHGHDVTLKILEIWLLHTAIRRRWYSWWLKVICSSFAITNTIRRTCLSLLFVLWEHSAQNSTLLTPLHADHTCYRAPHTCPDWWRKRMEVWKGRSKRFENIPQHLLAKEELWHLCYCLRLGSRSRCMLRLSVRLRFVRWFRGDVRTCSIVEKRVCSWRRGGEGERGEGKRSGVWGWSSHGKGLVCDYNKVRCIRSRRTVKYRFKKANIASLACRLSIVPYNPF